MSSPIKTKSPYPLSSAGGSHGIPSPSVFANMAAAVGQHNPIDENASNAAAIQIASTSSANQNTGSKQAVDLAVASLGSTSPYAALLYNVEHFANSQLSKLEELNETFFNLYENVIIDDSISMNEVVQAHTKLMEMIDQLLLTATQAGFSGLACPSLVSETETATIPKVEDTQMSDLQENDQVKSGDALDGGSIPQDIMNVRFAAQSKDSYERRERVRESASMITNILAHTE